MAVLYEDSLLRIESDELTVKRYYLPFPKLGARHITTAAVAKIEKKPVDLGSGQWRIWGTSSLGRWMPFDAKRPYREAVFWLHFKATSFRIGFTVEDTDAVTKALTELNLLA